MISYCVAYAFFEASQRITDGTLSFFSINCIQREAANGFCNILFRDVKFVFFPNSNFVCKIRILFELRLGLRYILVSSVHHYHWTQVPASGKNECVRLANPRMC